MSQKIILPAGSVAHSLLADAAQKCKAVVFVGLPGVGKTLMLQQMALLAHAAGRPLYLLQWDVARQGFESPEILGRYPEIEGSTHAMIRKAAGIWVRGAVGRWAEEHRHDAAILLGEAPFIGNRLVELVRIEDDAAESLLAGDATAFLIPAPTLAVRREIERARAREMARPLHEREASNAPMHLLDLLMRELRTAGVALGVQGAGSGVGYDPAVYVAVYERLLRSRHSQPLPIEECLPVTGSAYDLAVPVVELRPDAPSAAEAMASAEALGAAAVERIVTNWFHAAD